MVQDRGARGRSFDCNPPCPGPRKQREARITPAHSTSTAADPTAAWPPASPDAPSFDWSELRFGPIAFGDPLDRAEPLGRPDRFRWLDTDRCEMLYARAGYGLHFEGGRFSRLTWYIAPDPDDSDETAMEHASPALDEELALTGETSIDQLRAHLGTPSSENKTGDGTVLVYAGDGVALDFVFGADGRLKRWNLRRADSA